MGIERIIRITRRGWVHVLLVGIGLVWLVPSLGLFVTSFRSRADIAASGWWTALLDWRYSTANYYEVLTNAALPPPGFANSFMNSLIITIPSTIFPILLASMAAYAFAWLNFKGRRFFYLLIVAMLVVPLQTTWIPVLKLYAALDLSGTYTGIWLAHTAYGLPFAVFMLYNFFSEIPSDLLESAFIDGADHLSVFMKIVLPLSVPALASLAIFQFVWVWNDLMNALIFLQDSTKYPLTVGIQKLLGQYGSEWDLLAAGAFISMSMPLLVFFGLQRYFVRGLTAGAVKG